MINRFHKKLTFMDEVGKTWVKSVPVLAIFSIDFLLSEFLFLASIELSNVYRVLVWYE